MKLCGTVVALCVDYNQLYQRRSLDLSRGSLLISYIHTAAIDGRYRENKRDLVVLIDQGKAYDRVLR